MQKQEVKRVIFTSTGEKSIIECIDADGVLVWAIGLPAGTHKGAKYAPMMPQGSLLHMSGGVSAMIPPSRVQRQSFGAGSHASGANPDFKVTSASRFQREMDLKLAQLTAKSDLMDRKFAAMEKIAVKKAAYAETLRPKEPDVEVVEPIGETTIEPAEKQPVQKEAVQKEAVING